MFAIANFVFTFVCWFFVVETSGLSLEEIDKMFEIKYYGGKSMTYPEAAKTAKEDSPDHEVWKDGENKDDSGSF